MAVKHELENLLNGRLADLLEQLGIPSIPEKAERGKRMDVVATVEGLRVVLEAETGFGRTNQAVRDADERLRQGLTSVVFAVCYPDGATRDGLETATFRWLARTEPGALQGEWSQGSITDLADAVRRAPSLISDADATAQLLSDALDAAVQRLDTPTRRALARTIDLPQTKQSAEGDDGWFTASKRGLLVVATAMLFHHRVHPVLPSVPPESWSDDWPPPSPAQCAEIESDVVHRFRSAWRAILAVNYRPVMETAHAALAAMPAHPDAAAAIQGLAVQVERIAARISGLRHDLLGRVFHRVLDTARYDGSFYTSTAGATLLASLAIRESDADWLDANAVARLRIADPACGTGTLLMAASERIRDLRRAAGRSDDATEEELAIRLVEDVLYGYDINLTATHMAASTLGMLSPSTQFHRLNIFRTLLGVHEGSPYAGSLEFLDGQPRLLSWPTVSRHVDVQPVGDGDDAETPPPPMDLIIMNPPFTRASLRHDQFSPGVERSIKRREKEMLDRLADRAAARLHSSGGPFVVLANRMLKQADAALALLLPTVVATAPGNKALRQYLARDFFIDLVVTSHDPQRAFFSENTAIGESLIICRRWPAGEPKPDTRFINLSINPATPIAALDTAARIMAGEEGDFTVQHAGSAQIEDGDWFEANLLSPSLMRSYRDFAAGILLPDVVPLDHVASIGGQGRSVPTAYHRRTLPGRSGRRAFWEHDTRSVDAIQQTAEDHIEPKEQHEQLAERYWAERSRLLLSERVRLNTGRVLGVWLQQPAIGSAWVTCRPISDSVQAEQAIALYMNSSIGILSRLGGRSNRVLSYPRFALPDIRNTPIPAAVATTAAKALSEAYATLASESLQPFPELDRDPIRQQIDDAISQALSLDPERVAEIRRDLAEEPSITNRRYRADSEDEQ